MEKNRRVDTDDAGAHAAYGVGVTHAGVDRKGELKHDPTDFSLILDAECERAPVEAELHLSESCTEDHVVNILVGGIDDRGGAG